MAEPVVFDSTVPAMSGWLWNVGTAKYAMGETKGEFPGQLGGVKQLKKNDQSGGCIKIPADFKQAWKQPQIWHERLVTGVVMAQRPETCGHPWVVLMPEGEFNLEDASPNESAVLVTVRDTAEGLAFLHSRALVHGDLHPRNILIFGDRVCLTDWGLGLVPPPDYLAPEVSNKMMTTYASDIFALGVIMQKLLPMAGPFADDLKVKSAMATYTDPTRRPTALELYQWASAELQNLEVSAAQAKLSDGPPYSKLCASARPRSRSWIEK